MAKRYFRRFMSGADAIRGHRWLNWLAPGLKHPSLWHLNRHSVSRAMGIGLFWAMIPMPWQMIPAALSAVALRGNVAIAVAMVWISNPFTWGPIWYATYRLGRWILGEPALISEEAGWKAMWQQLGTIWKPLFLGSTLAGILMAAAAYLAVNLLWRLALRIRWNGRKRRKPVIRIPRAKKVDPAVPAR